MQSTTGDDYVSPYAADALDERLWRSVMVAQVGRRSIHEVHQRGAHRPGSRALAEFKPSFDEDAFSSALGMVEVGVEGLCVEGAEGWEERQRLVCHNPRLDSRLLGPSAVPKVLEGADRATNSLYDPLENLECMLGNFLGKVEAWAAKAKYFKQVTNPFIGRTIKSSTSEASTADEVRDALDTVGPIDTQYVNSFDLFLDPMQEPILELRALGEFIGSIMKEGDEIAHPGSSRTQSPSSIPPPRSGETLNPATEASGVRASVETKTESALPTSSTYFNTILSHQPATQASTTGQVNMESEASTRDGGSNALADLLEATGYIPDSKKKSPSPTTHEPRRLSIVDLEGSDSPSYSPPPSSPSLWTADLLLERIDPPLETPATMLSKPAPMYNRSAHPPPGTPIWKIDLNARKGHSFHTIHVGPRELSILSRCLGLVHEATRKGEKCARIIAKRKRLAVRMQAAYKQWEDVCSDLENNVRIQKMEKGEIEEIPDKKDDGIQDWFPASMATTTTTTTAHHDARDFGLVTSDDGEEAWGYSKLDAPSSLTHHGRRLDTIDEGYDDDETDTEDWQAQARGTAGLHVPPRSLYQVGMQPWSGKALSSSHSGSGDKKDKGTTTGTDTGTGKGKEVVTHSKEHIGASPGHPPASGPDCEMPDVDLDDDAADDDSEEEEGGLSSGYSDSADDNPKATPTPTGAAAQSEKGHVAASTEPSHDQDHRAPPPPRPADSDREMPDRDLDHGVKGNQGDTKTNTGTSTGAEKVQEHVAAAPEHNPDHDHEMTDVGDEDEGGLSSGYSDSADEM